MVIDEASESFASRVGDEAFGGKLPDDWSVFHPIDVVVEEVVLDECPEIGVCVLRSGPSSENIVDFNDTILSLLAVGVLKALDNLVEHIRLALGVVEGNNSVGFLFYSFYRKVVDEILDLGVDVVRYFGNGFRTWNLAIMRIFSSSQEDLSANRCYRFFTYVKFLIQ